VKEWFRPSRERLIARIDRAFAAEDGARALREARRAVRRYPDDPDLRIRLGDAWLDEGQIHLAEAAYRETTELDPRYDEAWTALADARVELADWTGAEQAVQQALAIHPRSAAAYHVRGVIEELTGRVRAADRSYARAARLDPRSYFEPYRISSKAFDAALRMAIDELPADLREALTGVRILTRRFPSPTEAPPGLYNPLLLGLFEGTALTQRSMEDPMGAVDARIWLFQGNLERACPTREDLIDEIRITLLHEIGHYLGYDEEAVWKRGLR